MGMTLDTPLSDQEIDELEAFLESDATPREYMDITALDGFSPVIRPRAISKCVCTLRPQPSSVFTGHRSVPQ
jgi:hypothetical protein